MPIADIPAALIEYPVGDQEGCIGVVIERSALQITNRKVPGSLAVDHRFAMDLTSAGAGARRAFAAGEAGGSVRSMGGTGKFVPVGFPYT